MLWKSGRAVPRDRMQGEGEMEIRALKSGAAKRPGEGEGRKILVVNFKTHKRNYDISTRLKGVQIEMFGVPEAICSLSISVWAFLSINLRRIVSHTIIFSFCIPYIQKIPTLHF